MQRILSVGNLFQVENPETQVVEQVGSFNIELVNRLSPEKQADLPFTMGQSQYDNLFKRTAGFGRLSEANEARDFLNKIMSYETANTDFFIDIAQYTNTFAINVKKQSGIYEATDIFGFADTISFNFMKELLTWINEQEQYF